MKNRNVKWHKMSAEAAIRQLHTDAACGLSRKAARSRYRKLGVNTLFDGAAVRNWDFWKPVLCDPAILFMLFSILLALLFGKTASVVLVLSVFVAVLAVCARLTGTLLRMHQTMRAYRVPTVTVLREGRIYRISARRLVVGDILLLQAGDVVGADCRVLAAEDCLRARILYRNGEGKLVKFEQSKRAELVYPYESAVYAPSCQNILYGKSEILCGSARAVVTETGQYSFLGAMESNSMQKDPSIRQTPSVAAMIPYFRAYSLLLIALLVPTALIGFFTAPEGSSLLSTFLPLAIFCGSGACAFPEFCFSILFANGYRQTCRGKNKNPSVFQSPNAIDRFMGITDLFVMGRSATSDGILHLHRAALGNGEVSLIGGDQPQLSTLCEVYELLFLAEKVGREEEYSSHVLALRNATLRRELHEACGYDAEALLVRLQSVSVSYDADGAYLDVHYKNANVQYGITEQRSILHACTAYEYKGSVYPLEREQKERLLSFLEASKQECGACRIVTRRDGGRVVLLGVLSCREQVQPFLPSVLEELETCGIRVSFFLQDDTDDTLLYAENAKLPRAICRASMLTDLDDLIEYYGKYRVFAGFSSEQIRALLERIKKGGRRTAVWGDGTESSSLQNAAALRIACDPLDRSRETDDRVVALDSDPDLPSRSSQSLLARAQMLVPRATQNGGGLASVLQALFVLRASRIRMNLLLRYWVASRMLSLILVVLSVISGIGAFTGAQLLWSGPVMDLVALVWILNIGIPEKRLHSPISFGKKPVSELLLHRQTLLPPMLTSLILWGYVLLLRVFSKIDFAQASAYLFFSLLLVQAYVLYQAVYRGGAEPDWRYDLLPAVVVFAPVLLLFLLSAWIPTLLSVSALAWFGWILFASLPLAPLLFLLLDRLLPLIKR